MKLRASALCESLERRLLLTGTGLSNIGQVDLPAADPAQYCAGIDPTTGFGYFGSSHPNPAFVTKVNLNGPLPVPVEDGTANSIPSGVSSLSTILVDTTSSDPLQHYLYVAGGGGKILKMSPGSPTQDPQVVATLTPTSSTTGYFFCGALDISSADPNQHYAYFGVSESSGGITVLRVRLSDFSDQGSETLNIPNIRTCSIDTIHHYLYFSSFLSSSAPSPEICKVNLATFVNGGSSVATYNLGASTVPGVGIAVSGHDMPGFDIGLIVDPVHQFAYMGSLNGITSPGTQTGFPYNQSIVVRVNLGNGDSFPANPLSELYLNVGEVCLTTAQIDLANGNVYFGTDLTYPGHVYEIHVGDGTQPMTEVGRLNLNLGTATSYPQDGTAGVLGPSPSVYGEIFLRSSILDIAQNSIYYGTDSSPGQIVRVDINGATVSGQVFQDNNSNGTFDGADTSAPFVGQTIYLDENNNNTLDAAEPTATVAANGTYSFYDVPPGTTGTVRLVNQPAGFALSNTASNGFTTSAFSTSTVNLTYFQTLYTGVGNTNSNYDLTLNGSNINILVGGVVSYIAPKSILTSLTFNFGSGNDALTVDASNGNPIPSSGVSYNGGAGTDSLTFIPPAGINSISLSATQLSLNISSNITYSNVEALIINVTGGSDTFTQTAAPGNNATLAVSVGGAASSLTFAGDGTGVHGTNLYNLASLAVSSNGLVTLAAAASGLAGDETLLTTQSLNITGTGRLDITSNRVDVHYGSGSDPIGTIQPDVIGGSITSTLDDALHAVGYADGKDGAVSGLKSGDILIRYTVIGDANLDGSVNFSDLLVLAANYGITGAAWDSGDFNGDATVNFSDLLSLAADYGSSLNGPQASPTNNFSSLWAKAQADVSAGVTHAKHHKNHRG